MIACILLSPFRAEDVGKTPATMAARGCGRDQ
jgi:hypothetical protein